MDFLKAEIERKRRQVESSSVLAPGKKYFKRGDLAAKQTEEYLKKHEEKVKEQERKKEQEIKQLKTIKEGRTKSRGNYNCYYNT